MQSSYASIAAKIFLKRSTLGSFTDLVVQKARDINDKLHIRKSPYSMGGKSWLIMMFVWRFFRPNYIAVINNNEEVTCDNSVSEFCTKTEIADMRTGLGKSTDVTANTIVV